MKRILKSKKKIGKSLCSFVLIMSIVVSLFVMGPVANAGGYYNATQTLISRASGVLYNGDSKTYSINVASESEVVIDFNYYDTDGDYRLTVKDSSGFTEYDTSSSYADTYYMYLSKGRYTITIQENDSWDSDYDDIDGGALKYAFSVKRNYYKTIYTKSVKLNRKNVKICRYNSFYLSASYSPSNSTQSGSWKSSNKKVATVDSYGYVYAKNYGKTTITYKHGSKTAKCKVTVNNSYLEIGKGKSQSVRKWMKYVKGYKKAKWKSSKSSKVSVNKKGKIKAKKGGQVTITAKIKGTKYTIKVYSYDKKKLKKETKASLKERLYVPGSLKINSVKYPDFRHCYLYYSAKNLYGTRIYGCWVGFYSYGNFYCYKRF